MPDAMQLKDLPPEVWNGVDFTTVHAVVLFAGLENSFMLSGALPPNEYQKLINELQAWMINQIWQLEEQHYFVGEYSIAGDQLRLFLYDPNEVTRNYLLDGPNAVRGAERAELIAESHRINAELVFCGVKAAVALKNSWLPEKTNLQRVRNQLDLHGLGIAMHAGQAHLCNRADDKLRIEGYTINFGKRIAALSRVGKFSRIMLSQEAHDKIRCAVSKHTMLRQRIFFHQHDADIEVLKAIAQPIKIYELKFFSRIGITLPKDVINIYEKLFVSDRNNLWAYYQLFEHYAYHVHDWDKVFSLAKQALLVHPNDEKVLLDMSRCYLHRGSMDQAFRFAELALKVNSEFDLVYEHLAVMAHERGDLEARREYLSKALSLTPGSPICHLNFGFALCDASEMEEAAIHILEAFEAYPGFLEDSSTRENLNLIKSNGKLPQQVQQYIDDYDAVHKVAVK
jgi:tetratricopeptide (TPR) repeat protein